MTFWEVYLMITITLAQPEARLGDELTGLLETSRPYTRIIFVSAFTALKTILRLREGLLAAADAGTSVRLIVGIDLHGTSREVLEELLRWNCEVFVYHNPLPDVTFHPKIYLFVRESDSTLFVGSNNLTDPGLYTNYEAATRYEFKFPDDANEYKRLVEPLGRFLCPAGPTVCRLDAPLIDTLSARGMLPTEAEARQSRRARTAHARAIGTVAPPNPFSPVSVGRAPLLPISIRSTLPAVRRAERGRRRTVRARMVPRPAGVLVWRKRLTPSDALRVRSGSHHVGGVRLTQARSQNPPGFRIDQTTYFRNLFDDYDWEQERGRHADQEHTFVPIRIMIRGRDYGVQNFEISHKPSGEAGQLNYTTILRWGRQFKSVITRANLTDAVLSLYETTDHDVSFFIEITDA
jgi:HKD family nuclease